MAPMYPQHGFDYLLSAYGLAWKNGDRCETEEGPGTVVGADKHLYVQLDGQRHAEPWHPDDVMGLPEEDDRPRSITERASDGLNERIRAKVDDLKVGPLSDRPALNEVGAGRVHAGQEVGHRVGVHGVATASPSHKTDARRPDVEART